VFLHPFPGLLTAAVLVIDHHGLIPGTRVEPVNPPGNRQQRIERDAELLLDTAGPIERQLAILQKSFEVTQQFQAHGFRPIGG